MLTNKVKMIKTKILIIHPSLMIKNLEKYKYQLRFHECKNNSLIKLCRKMIKLCNIYAETESKC